MLEALKKCLSATTSLTLMTLLFTASICLGQSRQGDVITNVPFPFVVANQTLPPGRYIVTPVGEKTLRIYAARKQGVLVQTHRVQGRGRETAKLLFHRYRDTYFLSEVWGAGNGIGSQLFTSRAEKEAARSADKEIAVVCSESAAGSCSGETVRASAAPR